ncbi:MAG TPA: ribosome biogenesis factor YjgA [Gaiellaceae bacterium]|nr:ribosome biogenesis factor YjgA [Gaiellaceae bacterium]
MRRRELPGGIAPPTKTELKRQAHAVQELAERLIDAPDGVVEGLELPEKLADSIALARRITSHAARVRQRQFVAKLMRGIDPAPLEAALSARSDADRLEAVRFKRAERWRDRLVAGGADAIADFRAEHPAADRAELGRLVAAAVAESKAGRRAGAGRKLFRFVQDALAAPG